MLRFYTKLTFVMLVVCMLVMLAALVIGRWQYGAILVYTANDFYNEEDVIMLMDVAHRKTLRVAYVDAAASATSISPNGELAIMVSTPVSNSTSSTTRRGLWLWDGAESYQIPMMPFNTSWTPAFSADGRLAFVICDYNLCDIGMWDGTQTHNLTKTPHMNEGKPVWDNSGQLVYNACELETNACDLWLWDGQTSRRITDTPDFSKSLLAWSADGRLAYLSCTTDDICDVWLWDGQTNHNLSNTPQLSEGYLLAWNSDGHLAYSACTLDINDCDLWLWDGQLTRNLTDTPDINEFLPSWISRQQLIFYGCERSFVECHLHLWDSGNITILNEPSYQFASGAPAANDLGQAVYVVWTSGNFSGSELWMWDGTQNIQLTHTTYLFENSVLWLP